MNLPGPVAFTEDFEPKYWTLGRKFKTINEACVKNTTSVPPENSLLAETPIPQLLSAKQEKLHAPSLTLRSAN